MTDDYFCYNILRSDSYGRYAVAAKTLQPGDLIVSENPFTYGPKADSFPVCLGCHGGIDGKTLCSKCGWPVCNKYCEELPIHKENECLIFSKAKIKFTPVKDLTLSCPQYECITPLRVLLTKERYPEKWEKEIKTLESHKEEREKTNIWEVESVNVVGFLHKVCKLGERFSEELIHFACGILEVNAFVAPAGMGYDMRCLYPKSSLLTHSCAPNVGHYIFSKPEIQDYRIYVRAMVRIQEGQELLLSYTQTLSPTLFRRAHLKEGKFFNCSCKRCADPTELETNLSTLKCSKCANGWVLPVDSLDEKADWKCSFCEFLLKGDSVFKFFRAIEKEIEELDYSVGADSVLCREAFLEKYSSSLHPNHAFLMTVKCSLSQLYGKSRGYLLKDLSDELLKRKIDFCTQINQISEKIKPGLSRQRGWNLYEMQAGIIILSKKQFKSNEIDEKQFKAKLQEASKYLEEVVLIFSYEDSNSLEGIAGKIAFQSLQELRSMIETS